HPQRPLRGEDRLRLHRDQRRRDVGLLRAAALPADDAQPSPTTTEPGPSPPRDRLPRRARPGAAGALHPRPRALPAADPRAHRADGRQAGVAGAGRRNALGAAGEHEQGGTEENSHPSPGTGGPTERTPGLRSGAGQAVNFHEPHIDYAGISPVIALTVGLCVVLLSAVFKPLRRSAPILTMLTLGVTAGLLIWQWDDPKTLVTGALRLDDLAISISLIAILMAASCVVLWIRE